MFVGRTILPITKEKKKLVEKYVGGFKETYAFFG